eukprot:g15518.t1
MPRVRAVPTQTQKSAKTVNVVQNQATVGRTFNALDLFKALEINDNYVKDDTVMQVDTARKFKKVVCYTPAVTSAMTDDLHRLQKQISKILCSKRKTRYIACVDPTDCLPLKYCLSKYHITCTLVPFLAYKRNERVYKYERARLVHFSNVLKTSFGFELDITNSMGNIKKYLESGFMTGVRLDEYYENKYSGIHMKVCGHLGQLLVNMYGVGANNEFADATSCLLAHDVGIFLLKIQGIRHKNIIDNQCYILSEMPLDEFIAIKDTIFSTIMKRVHEKRRSQRRTQRPFSMQYCTFAEFLRKASLMDYSEISNRKMLVAEAIYNHMHFV